MGRGTMDDYGWYEVDDVDLNDNPAVAGEIFRACGQYDWKKVDELLAEHDLAPLYGRVTAARAAYKPDDILGEWLTLKVQIKHGDLYKEKAIEVPGFIAHWRDDSWGNDAVAFTSFIRYGEALVMAVNYEHEGDREVDGRYMLAKLPVDAHGDYDWCDYDNGKGTVLYEGDDTEKCAAAVKAAERSLLLSQLFERRFTMDGEPLTVTDFVADNEHDDELNRWLDELAQLSIGQTMTLGGGAAAEFTFKREA